MEEVVAKIKEVKDKKELQNELKKKQDEFLDVYSLYMRTGLQWIKEEVLLKAYELHVLDKNFSFEI